MTNRTLQRGMIRSKSDSQLINLSNKQLKSIIIVKKYYNNNNWKTIANYLQDIQFVHELVYSDDMLNSLPVVLLMIYTLQENEYKKRIKYMIVYTLLLVMLK
jgi:hypothetical protein